MRLAACVLFAIAVGFVGTAVYLLRDELLDWMAEH